VVSAARKEVCTCLAMAWLFRCGFCRSPVDPGDDAEDYHVSIAEDAQEPQSASQDAASKLDESPEVTPEQVQSEISKVIQQAEAQLSEPHAQDGQDNVPTLDGSFGMEEHRICPISGLSTLQGACPFAKPKAKAKDGGKKEKVKLQLDFKWEQDDSNSVVTVSVRSHPTAAFETFALGDSASKEDIKRQYKALSLKHHPDKNQDDVEAATERFQRIKDAYSLIKDTDGELAFPWEDHPETQQVVTGNESVALFAKVAMEACEEHHFKGLQLRHLVRTCETVKVLKFESETEDGTKTETRLEALCMDSKNFVNHLVKVHRKEAWEFKYVEAEE